ncbi:hypothetical protein MNBD_GAMMA08-2608 [hydrothermal vent metagenome]|uniref:Uncharacterized protein n=1 Tax=hydrothermal vent metagenome TaxID=652676 RepID=A0A3B0X230_9ZZZZ
MNIVKKIKKGLTLLVCMSMSVYAIPSFAATNSVEGESIKIELSDADMSAAIGANGSVDATLADYTVAGSEATAVFTNRFTTGNVTYSLDVVSSNGTVLENLATGTILQNTSLLVKGTPTLPAPDNKYIRARIWHAGLLGLDSRDASWAP